MNNGVGESAISYHVFQNHYNTNGGAADYAATAAAAATHVSLHSTISQLVEAEFAAAAAGER